MRRNGGRWPTPWGVLALAVVLGLAILGSPRVSRAGEDWGALDSLIGDWVTTGDETPGAGTGGFSFLPDLDGRVLVRRSHADYPATPERPAVLHSDLMIVHRDGASPAPRAVYFDNEGHVIHYTVTATAAGDTIEFLSERASSAPTYRLRYLRDGADRVRITFEIAPPGGPGGFAPYLSGGARRVAAR